LKINNLSRLFQQRAYLIRNPGFIDLLDAGVDAPVSASMTGIGYWDCIRSNLKLDGAEIPGSVTFLLYPHIQLWPSDTNFRVQKLI